MMVCSVINTILSYFGIECAYLSLTGGVSLFTVLFLYISSYAFGFCPYHRIPIHYCVICDTIAYYDMYVGIPITDLNLLAIYVSLFGISILLYLYLKFK